jgi:hypothetical protein
VFGVNQQIGQKVLIGSKGPMAGVNNSTTNRRNPGANHSMEPFDYMCRKVNYDYGISYEQLDAWAHAGIPAADQQGDGSPDVA